MFEVVIDMARSPFSPGVLVSSCQSQLILSIPEWFGWIVIYETLSHLVAHFITHLRILTPSRISLNKLNRIAKQNEHRVQTQPLEQRSERTKREFQLEMIYIFLIQFNSLTTSRNASAETGLKECLEMNTIFASLLAAFKVHSQVALISSSLIPTGRYAFVTSFVEDSEPA